MNAIEVSGLVKAFGSTRALDGVDLEVRSGAVYGILGPNGAGKTTTVRILTTLLKPSGGTARVLGHDVAAEPQLVRQKVSLTGQYASVDEDLTGQENLVLVGRLVGLGWSEARRRGAELLRAFDLEDAAARQVRTFSGGMRRRIDIAASLVTRPEILFLDEPTTGLDPRSRNQVWDLVREIAAAGTTVVLTTQYLEEADQLAERLAVIDRGRVIAEGTSRELKASVGGSTLQCQLQEPSERDHAVGAVERVFPGAVLSGTQPGDLVVKLPDPSRAIEVLQALSAANVRFDQLTVGSPTLDDVFFALTGHAAEDASHEQAKSDLREKSGAAA